MPTPGTVARAAAGELGWGMRTVWQHLAALCLAAILVVSCSTRPDDSPAQVINSRPAVDYQALETAIETKIMSGSVGWQTIGAVLVSVDGDTKIAHYRNGRKPDEALHVWSVTKSVTSALIGIALDEQIIGSLDQTLDELLPKYRRFMTVEEKQISLRQLMDMTAGFPPDEPRNVIWKVFQHDQDPVPLILTEGLSVPPGEVFQYSSRSSHLVSAVLQAALERTNGEQVPHPCSPTPGRNSSTRWRLTPARRTKSRWYCPHRCPTTQCLRSGGARTPPGCTAPAASCGSAPPT